MISIETARRILRALGPETITAQAMNAEDLVKDFEQFQIERSLKNTYSDWLSTILMTERIHLETDNSLPKTPAAIAARDDKLDDMRRRVYSVKLKGDEMKRTKKTAKKAPVSHNAPTVKKTNRKEASASSSRSAPTKPIAQLPAAAPKVGDPKLATEADFTTPTHPRLSDYRYYALVDSKSRIVGRGFLARVDTDARRSWFALRNDEQTKLWETSKWAIREITLERYQELTLQYLKSEGWPELKSARAKAA